MATAFEPVQSIVSSKLPATRIKNDAFLCDIKTLSMHFKLAIWYPTIQAPHTAINYCFNSPSFHLSWNLRQTKLRSEPKMTFKRTLIIFTLVSSNASILNEFQSILYVSNMDLYLFAGLLWMSIDNWRYNRGSCCFEEMKGKHVLSMNKILTYLDQWACAHCFLKEYNVMNSKGTQIERSC